MNVISNSFITMQRPKGRHSDVSSLVYQVFRINANRSKLPPERRCQRRVGRGSPAWPKTLGGAVLLCALALRAQSQLRNQPHTSR